MSEPKTNEQILEEALREVPLCKRTDISRGQMNDFLDRMVQSFLAKKIEDFPALCAYTRKINLQYNAELEQYGNRSSTKMIGGQVVNGTTGWSKDGSFKHKWIVPTDLAVFMKNCIYVNFWEDSNKKVRDSFMKAIMRGDDALTTLGKIRAHYGSDHSSVITEAAYQPADI